MRLFIRNYSLALISLFFFLFITTLLFSYLKKWSEEKTLQHFEFRTSSAESAIKRRISYYIQLLKAGKAFYNNSDSLTKNEWKNFVQNLEIKETFPGVQGIGFALWIDKKDLNKHLAKMRSSGYPDYKIYPEGARDVYTSIIYLEPFDWRNKRAFGYDMFADSTRRIAMMKAIDLNQPAVSGKVLLVQETESDTQPGFLIYIPVYSRGTNPTNVDERRNNIAGFIYSPFRAHDLFQKILNEEFSDIDIEIYDGEEGSKENLLFTSDSTLDFSNNGKPNRINKVSRIETAGKIWTIYFTTEPIYGFKEDNLPFVVLIGGCIISFLLFIVIYGISTSRKKQEEAATSIRQNAEMLQKVNQKLFLQNQELIRINNDLDNFIYAASHDLKAPILNIEGLIGAIEDTDSYQKDPEIKALAQLMNVSVNRFKSTILDLTEISKAQKSTHDEIQENNLEKIVEEICFDIKDLITLTNAKITKDFGQKSIIRFSRKNIRSIFYNLISNAIKYRSPDRIPEVNIRTEVSGTNVIIYVQDNGLGIDPENQDKIFTMFKRMHDHVEGSGVGLYIVKRIVDNAGGKIELFSQLNVGSTFKITLPESNTPGIHFGI